MAGLCSFQLALHLTQRLPRGKDCFARLFDVISTVVDALIWPPL